MNHATGTRLVLSVLGDHAGDIAEQTSVRADGHDLSIGRAEHCDWVLQAQGVSRQHAVVRHLNGMYFVEDRSTNGMLLNGTPLRGGEPVALGDGDRLQLDTFEILVALETPADERAAATARRDGERTLQTLHVERAGSRTTNADLPLPSSMHTDPLSSMGTGSSGSLIPGEVASATPLDPLAWFQTSMPLVGEPPAAAEASGHWNHASPMTDRFEPPYVDPAPPPRHAAVLPENWDRTRSLVGVRPTQPAIETAPQPSAPPAAEPFAAHEARHAETHTPAPTTPSEPTPVGARHARDPLATIPEAAATQAPTAPRWQPTLSATPPAEPPVQAAAPATPPPATTTPAIEPLFALVLDGVMDVLRARAELKNGFRLPATLIQRRENNPLKFAPTG
ncbi:MAG: type VI secretion system-associated FHA domain protein TagH, partial [Luteibacter sp.]